MGMTLILIIMAIVYLPILFLIYSSFSGGWSFYIDLFTTGEYMTAVGNTLLIAFVASLIATIIATMAATGILYMGKRTRAVTMAVNQLPVINADIVTSFSLVLLFVGLGMANFGLLKLLLAHVLIALPFCLLTILPKMRQLDANLIDAALDLGASPFKAFTSVIVPQLVPAMIQAFLLGFTLSLDDFVITQYNNSGVSTISTVVYGAIARRDIPDAFKALTTIIFVVILLVLIVMNLNAARIRKGIKLNKKIVAGILAAVMLLTGAGVIPVIINNLTPRSLVLKVYNWEDYIASDYEYEDEDGNLVHVNLLDKFTQEYRAELAAQGVKDAHKFRIEYHTFTDNEELYSKISTQHADYDLVFPSEYMVEKMANDGLLQTIDMTRLADDVELDETILARTSAFTDVYDANGNLQPNQAWAIPYMIGTVGIMYDTTVINKMQPDTGMDLEAFETMLAEYGFGVLFGEGNSQKYSGRITMKKSARDSIGIAMIYSEQRKSANHTVAEAEYYLPQIQDEIYDNTMLEQILNMDGDYSIDEARQVLMEQINTMHPVYENDNGKKSFIDPNNDDFAYGLYWSCDAGVAMYEMDQNNLDNEDFENPLRFYAPDGTNLWTDNFAIPTYAKNTDAAYAFMNFMLNHENAALNTDYVGSQMIALGDDITALKEDYGVPGPDEDDYDIFDSETNYACTIFPTQNNITYSAIMHNFDKQKEKAVNNLMVEVQNKAAQLTEDAGNSINWFLVIILILTVAALAWWLTYKLIYRRPRLTPTPLLPNQTE